MGAPVDAGKARLPHTMTLATGNRDLGIRIGMASVENKLGFVASERDLAVEARASAGMTSAAVAAGFDRQQQGVLVAIGPDFGDFLNLARRIALAPERLA